MEQKKQSSCYHTDLERAISGTFVSCEIVEALRLGYKILKTGEVSMTRLIDSKIH